MKTNDYVVEAVKALEQKDRVVASQPMNKSRTVSLADKLGRQGLAMAEAEALNEALMKLIDLCYLEEHGRLVNVDQYTGRIVPELPVPWNSRNYKRYGLMRREQADVLRWVMMYYSKRGEALFQYSPSARRWHLNLAAYPTKHDALAWLSRHEMTAGRWLSALEKLPQSSRTPARISKK